MKIKPSNLLVARLLFAAILAPTICLGQSLATVGLVTSSVSVPEFESEARIEVRRTGNLTSAVSVQYATTPASGAVNGVDYMDVSGVLTFEAGQQSNVIHVPIINDGDAELLQSFQVILTDPSAGAQLGRGICTVQIIDNDGPGVVGPLIVTVAGPIYTDWSGSNLRWGQGYPAATVRFDRDEALGAQTQMIADNEIVRGSNMNDQPNFTSIYTNNLRVNFLVADFGQVKITYDLVFATQLLDLMVLDVDEDDHVRIEFRRIDGTIIDPRSLQVVMQGDLSRFYNAVGQPQNQAATPPVWNPVVGTLSAAVTWNENRSYTILRPSEAVASVTVTLTGKRTGAHIYAGLWATPRPFKLSEARHTATGEHDLQWTSLPGVPYRIMSSSNLVDWTQVWVGQGAESPELTTRALVPQTDAAAPRFFRIQRW